MEGRVRALPIDFVWICDVAEGKNFLEQMDQSRSPYACTHTSTHSLSTGCKCKTLGSFDKFISHGRPFSMGPGTAKSNLIVISLFEFIEPESHNFFLVCRFAASVLTCNFVFGL